MSRDRLATLLGQLAAHLLVQLGREELAAIAAERGVAAAVAGDDELQWATLHGSYCWALLSQARYGEAESLVGGLADRQTRTSPLVRELVGVFEPSHGDPFP